jgi:hypothetical protein
MPPNIVNPDRDITTTAKWAKIMNSHLATPVEKVLMNNMEILAGQISALLRGQEAIATLLEKYTSLLVLFILSIC